MKITVDVSSMKPQAVALCAKMLSPSGPEPLSRPLTAWLRGLSAQIDAIVDVGGEGSIEVPPLTGLCDEDLRRLALRFRCVMDALNDRRPGRDLPFLQLLAGLRVACANEQMLRDISAGRLSVAGPAIEDDNDL